MQFELGEIRLIDCNLEPIELFRGPKSFRRNVLLIVYRIVSVRIGVHQCTRILI